MFYLSGYILRLKMSQEPVEVEFCDGSVEEYEAVVLINETEWMKETPFEPGEYAVGITESIYGDILVVDNIKRICDVSSPQGTTLVGSDVYRNTPDDLDEEVPQTPDYAESAHRTFGYGSTEHADENDSWPRNYS